MVIEYQEEPIFNKTASKPEEKVCEEPSLPEEDFPRNSHWENLNIYISEEVYVSECLPSAVCDCLTILVSIMSYMGLKGFQLFNCMTRVLSLTPRHVAALIWPLYKRCRCHCVTMPCFKAVFLILSVCLIIPCDGGSVIETSQTLPKACLDYVNKYDCPLILDKFNLKCCSSFPGTVFHCQRRPDSSNFPACLPDEIVPKGYAGILTKDENGYPKFERVPCDNSTFESEDRVSSSLTFPYCLGTKNRCNDGKKRKKELLCSGGTVADDKCTCSAGYEPVGEGCQVDKDFCLCKPLNCPQGEVAVHTKVPPGSCNDLEKEKFVVHFRCEKFSTTTSPPSVSQSSAASGSASCISLGIFFLIAVIGKHG